MIDELGNEVTDDRVQALVEHIRFKSDTMSWETGLILKALMVEGASTRDALAAAEAQNAELVAALEGLRWGSRDGDGCFDPAAKFASEWMRWEPCANGEHQEKCQRARAALSRQPAGGVVGE